MQKLNIFIATNLSETADLHEDGRQVKKRKKAYKSVLPDKIFTKKLADLAKKAVQFRSV